MDFLAERALAVEFFELFQGGQQNAEDFQDSQQPQKPQGPQVYRHKGLQQVGQDGQQVDDGKGARHIGQAGVAFCFEFLVLGRQVKAGEVFDHEHDDGEHIKGVEPVFVILKDRRDMFEHHGEQVGDDQNRDPFVHRLLVIARDIGVEQPGIQPLAARQIRGDVGIHLGADQMSGIQVGDFDDFVWLFHGAPQNSNSATLTAYAPASQTDRRTWIF